MKKKQKYEKMNLGKKINISYERIIEQNKIETRYIVEKEIITVLRDGK